MGHDAGRYCHMLSHVVASPTKKCNTVFGPVSQGEYSHEARLEARCVFVRVPTVSRAGLLNSLCSNMGKFLANHYQMLLSFLQNYTLYGLNFT